MNITDCFSHSYAEAREKFVQAASTSGMSLMRTVHPGATGKAQEELSMDYALFEPDGARDMLILTSGTHGVEGFCGSGCQIALLQEPQLLQRFASAKTALLLVHAVNPHGFSHLRRVNEDNIDLNRNLVDFAGLSRNDHAYAQLDPLLLPQSWPPSILNKAALMLYVARHGRRKLQDAITRGQYSVADGMFYGGAATAWSVRELSAIFTRHVQRYARTAWIDIHTGLGARGHGEKISSSRDAGEQLRATQWWGSDVKAIASKQSVSSEVDGILINLLRQNCPAQESTAIALEFGTCDPLSVLNALRADHWLHRHPQTPAGISDGIRQATLDAFYVDSDDWREMVYGQLRQCVWQALRGLSEHA